VSADTLPPVAVDLGSALEEGRLRLVYRPVASLTTGTLLGVEALIRWGGEAAAPDEVREALEAGSALLPVVHWAVARAVADVRTVAPSRTDHLSVWLALPCRSALAASTRGAFETAFAGPWGDLDADSAPSIVVDVHEDELASVVRRGALHRHVEDLVGVGPVSLGVDRFSADAVPLGLMRSLAVASLTVDPHLLTRAEGDDVDRDLLRSLVAAAGALGVVTVADEVDSPADLELARSLGLHAVKGDLVGPFAPLETYSDLLHAGLVPLPDSFDRRTHDELTGDPLEGSITERAARPRPEETPPDPAAGEVLASAESGAELAESELLSQDVLAAIRWLDELDRTAQERLSGEGTDEPETGPVPEQPAQPRAEDPAPAEAGTADGPRTPRPSEPVPTDADGFVPALAPYEPAPPAARMPGLDLVDRPAEAPPRPALWSGSAPTLEPTLEPHAEPETVAEQPVPASATAAPATAPTTAGPVAEVPAATASDSDDIVIELRDAPEDIGAALAAELGVDLTPFDRQEVGALLDRPYGAADAVAQPPAAPSAAPPASPFAGMALPPSPFLVLRPKDPEA
jgi:EAL domain-containing protein (putative c-di-GMP-specific phosphodiesterase class I)